MIRKQRIIIVGIAGRRFARESWGDPVDAPDFDRILIPYRIDYIPGNTVDTHPCYQPLKCDGPRAVLHEEPMGTRSSKVLQSPATKQITDKDFIGIDYTAVKGKINSIYAKKMSILSQSAQAMCMKVRVLSSQIAFEFSMMLSITKSHTCYMGSWSTCKATHTF